MRTGSGECGAEKIMTGRGACIESTFKSCRNGAKKYEMMRCSIAIIGLVLLMAGCSSPEAPHQKHTVVIEHMQFTPATLSVHKGDEVTFVNKDMVVHNVRAISGEAWADSLQTNDSFTMTASKTADYFCSLHPVMKGKIEVN